MIPTSHHSDLVGTNPLRARPNVRRLFRRELLRASDLVCPLLVVSASPTQPGPIPTVLVAGLHDQCNELWEAGVRAVKVFAGSIAKDALATEAVSDQNLAVQAVAAIRSATPGMCIISDTCLCSFTLDGQCALCKNGVVEQAATIELLKAMAVNQAAAGADFVAPSGMVDGAVRALRTELDRRGYGHVGVFPHLILDSCLYGGYRAVMKAEGTAGGVTRDHLQLAATEVRDVLVTAKQFVDEGATAILLEPALLAMDLLPRLKEAVSVPLGAFSVSGEFRMLVAAAEAGVAPRMTLMTEALTAIKRAGADVIFTYAAKEVAAAL